MISTKNAARIQPDGVLLTLKGLKSQFFAIPSKTAYKGACFAEGELYHLGP